MNDTRELHSNNSDTFRYANNLSVLRSEFKKICNDTRIPVPVFMDSLYPGKYDPSLDIRMENMLDKALMIYKNRYNRAVNDRDEQYNKLVDQFGSVESFMNFRQKFHNKQLAMVVTNEKEILQYSVHDGEMIPLKDAIYREPGEKSWRSHFYAPSKNLFGSSLDTFWFNLIVIWVFSILLFPVLYYDIIRKGFTYMETLRLNRLNKLRLKLLVKLADQNRPTRMRN
jgi:hypothetical protein